MPRRSGYAQQQRGAAPTPAAEPLTDREQRDPRLRWLIHLGVPVTVSLLIHAGLFVVLVLVSWEVLGGGEKPVPGEYEVAITDRSASEACEQLKWPGRRLIDSAEGHLQTDADPPSLDGLIERGALSDLARDEPSIALGESNAGGFGIGRSGSSALLGIGGGSGTAGGGGFGAGLAAGSGVGQAGVWDVKAAGSKFVYVVDFSGSIIVAVDDLKRELKHSIGELTPEELFAVFIFYGDGGSDRDGNFKTEAFAPKLKSATPDAKREFFAWIAQKAPKGQTEPLQAMKRALSLEPDAVFFFSDGYFDDSVVQEIAVANAAVAAQIHCFVFDELLLQDTSGLPRLSEGARRLKRVADASGGELKVVTGADLGR